MGKIPNDSYSQCYAIAKSYYTMLARRREWEEEILFASQCSDGQPKGNGTGNPTAAKAERLIEAKARNDWKIRAVEQAWARMADETEREFIKLNIFKGVRMHYIELPMSIMSMKRVRGRFIKYLAEELKEV